VNARLAVFVNLRLDMALALALLSSVIGLLPAQPPCRRDLLRAAPLAAAGLVASQLLGPAAASAEMAAPLAAKVTDKVFIDVRVIQSYDVAVLEDAAVRGRIVIGLFGSDAPQATQRFKEFVMGTTGQFAKDADGPSYASSSFEKLRPGEGIEGGRITGFDQVRIAEKCRSSEAFNYCHLPPQVPFGGVLEYQYRSRLVSLRPLLEVNSLKHDRRGLLTKRRLAPGPEFAITMGEAPALDLSNEVFGQVCVFLGFTADYVCMVSCIKCTEPGAGARVHHHYGRGSRTGLLQRGLWTGVCVFLAFLLDYVCMVSCIKCTEPGAGARVRHHSGRGSCAGLLQRGLWTGV